MNIIIDTHIFLWALSEPHKISEKKQIELKTPANTIYVSSITMVELMLKTSVGKLNILFDPVDAAQQSGFELLDFSAKDAMPLKDMPFHHKDPFDRMLIAQSVARKFHLMSDDTKFKAYDCKVI